jgi:hypothetical protein
VTLSIFQKNEEPQTLVTVLQNLSSLRATAGTYNTAVA